jgi:transposase
LREYQQRLSPVMRQHHVAGDKLFVDYSGKRQEIHDPLTGEVRMAEIFVAVLGASNYTYAEVTWSQALPDWIGSHVRLFRHIGGVTLRISEVLDTHFAKSRTSVSLSPGQFA